MALMSLAFLVISNWSPALLKLICSILMPAGIDGCQLAVGFTAAVGDAAVYGRLVFAHW